MSTSYQIGDVLDVTANTLGQSTSRVLVESGPHSVCNSDGEEWWLEWHCTSLDTGKRINISDRYSASYHIVKVS